MLNLLQGLNGTSEIQSNVIDYMAKFFTVFALTRVNFCVKTQLATTVTIGIGWMLFGSLL